MTTLVGTSGWQYEDWRGGLYPEGCPQRLWEKLGPVLLQLPPTLRADPGLLERCLACFPGDVRVAVEPRHPSWWSDEVREAGWQDAYVYFNNDPGGAAVRNAARFARLV
ncbi:DUF72 domain-containing protein [Nonomuraea rhizosphaerae]|uniref:DUF72 domain-containing protein n=1 Tax=Nonomuraea rhizosphaerae TaxID=2665663 RepID=UPI001C5F9541|nr:DUF72 domain-containing protein [Nonomuraea rhizosphaerae]